MKSFKQYITELFDSPVKVKKIQTISSHHHVYMFKVNNVPYHVHVQHLFASPGNADVDFGDRTEKPEDSMTTTGKQGYNASAVFSGVNQALILHQKEHPHIHSYMFDASNEKSGEVNPARTKLYGAMVRRVGGKQFGNSFKIPASALRESFDPEAGNVRELLKLKSADKQIAPPPHVYHVTPSSNVPSIMAKGLNPRADNLQDKYNPAIYVTGSEGDARRIAPQLRKAIIANKGQKKSWKEDYAILKINTSKIPNHKFYVDGYFPSGGYTKDTIPPESIEHVGSVSFKKTVKESFDPEAVKIANSTSRNSGAVGAKAITPRYVEQIANKSHKILDFGSGKDAAHAKRLRQQGLNVTAHEFGSNQNENHDKDALNRQYDHVYASNVLNVQSSKPMMAATLDQIHKATKKGGSFIGNFPMAPRKADDIDANHVEVELNKRFETVKRVGGTKKAPLFHAINPK